MAESSEKTVKTAAQEEKSEKSPNNDKTSNHAAAACRRDDTFYGSDDAFCTAAGAMSPKPSARPETGRLRRLFNDCDRA